MKTTDKKKGPLKVLTPKMIRDEKIKSALVVKLNGSLEKATGHISQLEKNADVYIQEIAKLVDTAVDKNIKLINAEKVVKLRKTVIEGLENDLERLRHENQRELQARQENHQNEIAAISSQRDQLVGYIQGAVVINCPVEFDATGNQKITALDLFLDKCTAEIHMFKNQAGYR